MCVQAKHKQKPIRNVPGHIPPHECTGHSMCGSIQSIPNTGRSAWIPKQFRCDNGRGEYDNKSFRTILAGAGTTYEPCPPYAHHKNGVAERIIAVITEKPRAMMIDARVPVEFWGETVNTANYLHRMTPNNGLIKRDGRDGYKAPYNTPHEMLPAYGKPKHDAEGKDISYKAPTHHLRRFGCHVSKLIPEAQRSSKFSPRSKLDVCDRYTRPPTRGNACGRA